MESGAKSTADCSARFRRNGLLNKSFYINIWFLYDIIILRSWLVKDKGTDESGVFSNEWKEIWINELFN
jgi:hypothetical protein